MLSNLIAGEYFTTGDKIFKKIGVLIVIKFQYKGEPLINMGSDAERPSECRLF